MAVTVAVAVAVAVAVSVVVVVVVEVIMLMLLRRLSMVNVHQSYGKSVKGLYLQAPKPSLWPEAQHIPSP